ncbi:bifunctional diaminohydroxyphosphoribosylaminopyrimidine deaminase/5-amino-6-(5-phosphoribosylamino)uracil reductase RibD [bacterium]|nr:bifunctional diaminohydroxyphosphoribosylaminopyrimidine deaminase/5-amino-6-(5-phosphoribosylamino)uracil reductase RibD [bacterium]
MNADSVFMQRAIELALQGRGWTSPHPMAGAVVTQGDQIVGEGFHLQAGQPHAEHCALDAAGEASRGGTLYMTIEPCHLAGRPSSCLERILAADLSRVVIAHEDGNPATAGRAIRALQEAGLQVDVGIEREAVRRLNEIFFKYSATRRPFVALRSAMSLDGKIATAVGERDYIGGPEAHAHLQQLRATYDAVLVGVTTLIQDDPDLYCTLPRARSPLRVVVDSLARTPMSCKMLGKTGTGRLRPNTLVAVTKYAPEDRIRALQALGAEILVCPETMDGLESHVDLNKLMHILSRRGITSVLVEGGGNLNAAALEAGIVDKLYCTIAPMIIGGKSALTPVEGLGVSLVEEALPLYSMTSRSVGGDLLIEAYLREA